MTVEAIPLAGDYENLATISALKAHCRIDADDDDALLANYQLAVVEQIIQVTDNPTLFTVAITDSARLIALHMLQCLLVADMYDRRYSTTPVTVRWSNHLLALADGFRSYRLLTTA